MSRRPSDSDEGPAESREKAYILPPTTQTNSVNRRLREVLSRSPSPDSKPRNSKRNTPHPPHHSQSDGPPRQRGEKRRRVDDYRGYGMYGRGQSRRGFYNGKRGGNVYDERTVRGEEHFRDRHSNKQPRPRSRSPIRRSDYDNNHRTASNDRNFGNRNGHNRMLSTEQGLRFDDGRGKVSFTDETKPAPEDNKQSEEAQPPIEIVSIEERRRRREAIKAKYKDQTNPLLIAQPNPATDSASSLDITPVAESPASGAVQTPEAFSGPGSPEMINIANDADLANPNVAAHGEEASPSAADYDPTMDMQEDRMHVDGEDEEERAAANYNEYEAPDEVLQVPHLKDDPKEPSAMKAKATYDMFASDDDEDDMFADESQTKPHKASPEQHGKELDQSLLDNWDDHQGYYRVIIGELLDGRYHVHSNLGKGMFSGVIRATDNQTGQMVAIKIIRANESMTKAGAKEMEIIQTLCNADPGDKKHLIRLERSFSHKGHLCMVFENLSDNLREVLKKFGRDVGINLKAVRSYAHQMFLGLSLLRTCNILHADLKPDNILVNESRTSLKLCDLGSAGYATENDITPYLVSRFYRAPEIILGMPYDFAIDMWSIGCTLFELYTGKILFTGPTNNQMLKSMMDCRGKFSEKMLKKCEFGAVHFNDDFTFRSLEKDKITGRDVTKILSFQKPTRDLKTRLMAAAGGGKGMSEVEVKELNQFADLLDKCLALNPERRITPQDALKHGFIHRAAAFPQPRPSTSVGKRPTGAPQNKKMVGSRAI